MRIDEILPAFETIAIQGRGKGYDECQVSITQTLVVYEIWDDGTMAAIPMYVTPRWTAVSNESTLYLDDSLHVNTALRCADVIESSRVIDAIVGGKYLEARRQLACPAGPVTARVEPDRVARRKYDRDRVVHWVSLAIFLAAFYFIVPVIPWISLTPREQVAVMLVPFLTIDTLLYIACYPGFSCIETVVLHRDDIIIHMSNGKEERVAMNRVIGLYSGKDGTVIITYLKKVIGKELELGTINLDKTGFKQIVTHVLPCVLSSDAWSCKVALNGRGDRKYEQMGDASFVVVVILLLAPLVPFTASMFLCEIYHFVYCIQLATLSIAFIPYLLLRTFPIMALAGRGASRRRKEREGAWPAA